MSLRDQLNAGRQQRKLKDAAREGAKPKEQEHAPKPQEKVPPRKPPENRKPKPHKDYSRYCCGHPVDVNQACRKCLSEARIKRAKYRKAKALAKREEQIRKGEQVEQDTQVRSYGRLPHLSHFDAVYNGKTQKWVGYLAVPDGTTALGVIGFRAESDGIFRLMTVLDKMYREWEWNRENQAREAVPVKPAGLVE